MPAALRATPRQRERTLRSLGFAYRDGLLGTGTFELRIDAALRARTAQQLRQLLADVPGLSRLRLVLEQAVRERLRGPLPTAASVNLVLPGPEAPPRLSIGRHDACNVVFTDPTVSRRHALLRREQRRWVIHDLGSANGTWVNGERVARRTLAPGDEVAFGALVARVI